MPEPISRFINSTGGYTTTTSTWETAKPEDTTIGDTLICCIETDTTYGSEQNSDGVVPPSGWTLIRYVRLWANEPYTAGGRRLSIWYRTVTAEDALITSYTWRRYDTVGDRTLWIICTFRALYTGPPESHNLTNFNREFTTSSVKNFDSAAGLVINQMGNSVFAVIVTSKYGLAQYTQPPTVEQSGQEWLVHRTVKEGNLSSNYGMAVASCITHNVTELPMQRFYMEGLYTSPYETQLLELVDEINDPEYDDGSSSSSSSTKRKKPLTEEQLLERKASRSRYVEYSRSHRSNLYLPVDRKYNLSRGYKNPPMPIVGQGR